MQSLYLYSRLFKYRSTENRSPTENFLTEALVDFLQRASNAQPKAIQTFISGTLLGSSTGESKRVEVDFAKRLAAAKSFRWETQVQLKRSGRNVNRSVVRADAADIVAYSARSDRPLLLIENKVDSPLGPRQLERYGEWLCERKGNRSGALIFLTGGTDPPKEFTDATFKADETYSARLRSVCTWSQIYGWIKRNHHFILAPDFEKFLAEQGFDDMNKDDLSVLNEFLSQPRLYGKVKDTIKAANDSVRSLPQARGFKVHRSTDFDKDAVYGHLSLDKQDQAVFWGFSPGRSEYFPGLQLPDKLHAFVAVESRKLRVDRRKFRWGWRIGETSSDKWDWWVCVEDAMRLSGSGGMTAGFVRWIEPRVVEGVKILQATRSSKLVR